MTYQGTVKNGVAVFESTAPPEGTAVSVQPIAKSTSKSGSIWNKMADFAGRAPDLPADAALNHDHYLYGKPKR
jgi:hypothetical protein